MSPNPKSSTTLNIVATDLCLHHRRNLSQLVAVDSLKILTEEQGLEEKRGEEGGDGIVVDLVVGDTRDRSSFNLVDSGLNPKPGLRSIKVNLLNPIRTQYEPGPCRPRCIRD